MSDSEDEGNSQQLKFTLVGDGTTGKTSLCSRLSNDSFGKQYQQTLGLDFFLKRFNLPGNMAVTLQVWDIGGQQLGGKMLETYLYGAHAVLLVYDMTNQSSFENLQDWLEIVQKHGVQNGKMPYLALIGNKKDLEHLRKVTKEHHADFQNKNDMTSFFLSAKSGDQVNFCFQKIACDILKIRLSKQDVEQSNQVVKAEIVKYKEIEAAGSSNANTKSSFCVLQ